MLHNERTMGPNPVLSKAEEDALAKHCIQLNRLELHSSPEHRWSLTVL